MEPSGEGEIGSAMTSGSAVSTTSCGCEADACRDGMLSPSLTGVPSTKLYVPLACTAAVTSNSAQVLAWTWPWPAAIAAVRAGRLFQVIPPSDQLLLVP